MARYYFDLVDSHGRVLDPDGTELLNEASAREHAAVVARELMRHREFRTRHWRLFVSDGERLPCFTILFATVDDSLAHLSPALRESFETLSEKKASLNTAIHDVRQSIYQVRATLARADGAPYLASVSGVRL